MNYITLNGIKSTLIKGLLIQSLPPISKPLMRAEVEEIDGRDGDIITKLGYSAYNKQIAIGLYGDFNINEVIAYFDSEGEVTFSNEPDKYYNYQIIDQIDFERLIRYRVALVNLHVQPFKYATTEKALTFDTTNLASVTVTNVGNTEAKPKIMIYGSGTISLFLGNNQIFSIELGTEGYITIDSAAMEAYKNGVLKNRLVTGDYDNFVFTQGENTITWSGTVTGLVIEHYSRWI